MSGPPLRDPFYTDFAELYDAHQRGVRGDIEFYSRLALEAHGLTVELGVGTGRVAIPAAAQGARILGIDIAAEMLAICRAKAREAGVRLDLALGDMRDFALREPAALVTIPHRAFLHNLTTADQRATLEACRRALAPGGRLALNVFNPDITRLAELMSRGRHFIEAADEEPATPPDLDEVAGNQVVESVMVMRSPDGRARRALLRVRYVYIEELERLLRDAGFETEAVLGDFQGSPFGPLSTEIVYVARAA